MKTTDELLNEFEDARIDFHDNHANNDRYDRLISARAAIAERLDRLEKLPSTFDRIIAICDSEKAAKYAGF